MNEEILKQMIEALLNLGEFNYSKDGLVIKANSTDNSLNIKVEYNEDEVTQERGEFVKYLESLDDDLFLEICEGLEVNEIQNGVSSNNIEELRSAISKFQTYADEVINNKIEYLESCLSKSHK